MRRFLPLFAFAASLALPAYTQTVSAPPPIVNVCPSTPTLGDLSKALDAAVSGPGNKDRTCLRDLLLSQARLSPMSKSPDGAFAPRTLTVDDWISAVAKRGDQAFYEVQIKVTSDSYGHFAHLWSTYEIRPTPDGKPEMTGINSIQAVYDGKRWRVLSIVWEPSTTAGPIPEKYLP